MQKYLVCIVCLCFFGVFINASAEVNPQNISKNNAAIEKQIDKACSKYSNVGKQSTCFSKLNEKYSDQGKLRGTKGYCLKHYSSLTTPVLIKKLKELLKLRQVARDGNDPDFYADSISGELTKDDYSVEIAWVAELLKKRNVTPKLNNNEMREFEASAGINY